MSIVGNILQTAVKLVMGAIQTISNGLMAIGGLLVRGAMAFVSVLMKATQAAMAYAKSVNDFRLGTGMGMKEAADTSLKFQSFGITPQMLAQGRGNEHHSVTKMMGNAWGVDANDPLSINRKARSFGNGMQGHAMRETFLESVGMNTDKGRWMASLSEEQMQDQLSFTQKTGSALGISPESMTKIAEALPLAQAKLETFLQLVQMKFVEGALPIMEKGIEWLSNFIGEKGPQIASTFASVFEWIFVEGPDVAINAARAVVDTFKWLSDGFFSIAHTVVAFLGTLESADSGLGGFVLGFLNLIDNVINTLQFLGDVWHNLIATMANFLILKIRTMAGYVVSALGVTGLLNTSVGKAAVTLSRVEFEPWQFHGPDQQSHLAADFRKTQQSGVIGKYADDAKKGLETAQAYVNDKFETANNAINEVDKATGTKNERADMYREMIGELKGINKHTEETARGLNGGGSDTTMVGTQDWLARFAVEQARQQYLMATR